MYKAGGSGDNDACKDRGNDEIHGGASQEVSTHAGIIGGVIEREGKTVSAGRPTNGNCSCGWAPFLGAMEETAEAKLQGYGDDGHACCQQQGPRNCVQDQGMLHRLANPSPWRHIVILQAFRNKICYAEIAVMIMMMMMMVLPCCAQSLHLVRPQLVWILLSVQESTQVLGLLLIYLHIPASNYASPTSSSYFLWLFSCNSCSTRDFSYGYNPDQQIPYRNSLFLLEPGPDCKQFDGLCVCVLRHTFSNSKLLS